MKKPIVKKKNIILALPSDQIKLGSEQMSKEVLGEVAYVGEDVELYKVGDRVLFDHNKATEIKYFDPTIYWKIYEDHITCGVEE